MSNTSTELRDCPASDGDEQSFEVLEPREVPLGGPRAMLVSRTLPQRARSLIGPWCFVDHFGPSDVKATGGMAVPRHPHTGLATVTLLFAGDIDHLDSTGFGNTVRPGEVNLMIAGRGVSHSEFSTETTRTLHGVQLWYALPDELRFGPPQSQHHAPGTIERDDLSVTVYTGTLVGESSPIDTRVDALSAQLDIAAQAAVTIDLDPSFEHGFLLDRGRAEFSAELAGKQAPGADSDGSSRVKIGEKQLVYVPPGTTSLTITTGDIGARMIVIGGRPFGEEIVMWWNFVGRTHAEIDEFRRRWQSEIGVESSPDRLDVLDAPNAQPDLNRVPPGPLFGVFPTDTPTALPAPELPNSTLKPRR